MKTRILHLCALICMWAVTAATAQDLYWIGFADKAPATGEGWPYISPAAAKQRAEAGIALRQETDLPLKPEYLSFLKEEGIESYARSKWLNAVVAQLSPGQKTMVAALPFVKSVTPVLGGLKVCRSGFLDRPADKEDVKISLTLSQIGAGSFLEKAIDGSGVAVGVIDAGYFGAIDSRHLTHLFKRDKIKAVKDWVNPAKQNHYDEQETPSDDHGKTVLEMICGREDAGEEGTKISGLAQGARFYLARTDHGKKEFRGEEGYWIEAMEWMDSLGVRLINTSLGYAKGFDKPEENYKTEQMDGKTSAISRAAQIASQEKGILLVVAAGNEGDDKTWGILSTPADAQGVLSVGATTVGGLKQGYSSIGPGFLPYLKPNISCMSYFGTSFSAPIITGFAACLMQAKPKASAKEVYRAIEQSGQLYPYGNNYVGYGLPDAGKALAILAGQSPKKAEGSLKTAKGKQFTLKLEIAEADKESEALLFHKTDKWLVSEQKSIKPKKGQIQIKRREGAAFTTVYFAGAVYEIEWK